MKKILILATLFFSLSFYGQSIYFSGDVYIGPGLKLDSAKKTTNFAFVTINQNKKTVSFSINGNAQNYLIESSNITNGGSTIKLMLSEGMQTIISVLSSTDVVIFPWDVSKSTVGYIKVKLTNDDKRLLGLNRS